MGRAGQPQRTRGPRGSGKRRARRGLFQRCCQSNGGLDVGGASNLPSPRYLSAQRRIDPAYRRRPAGEAKRLERHWRVFDRRTSQRRLRQVDGLGARSGAPTGVAETLPEAIAGWGWRPPAYQGVKAKYFEWLQKTTTRDEV